MNEAFNVQIEIQLKHTADILRFMSH